MASDPWQKGARVPLTKLSVYVGEELGRATRERPINTLSTTNVLKEKVGGDGWQKWRDSGTMLHKHYET
jgi:hypothetical protein